MLHNQPTILILGGSEIAYQLAQELQSLAVTSISSLAGRTQNPRIPDGRWRIGGFGGVEGLTQFLHDHHVTLMVDATHPFASKIQANARRAAAITGIGLLRLQRPLWQQHPDDRWLKVDNEIEAAAILPKRSTVFLALGRQHLHAFSERRDVRFVARMLEETNIVSKCTHFKLILDRPMTHSDEISLFQAHKIDMLVCRNSGACASYGKIAAARDLHMPVVVIMPPPLHLEVATLTTVQAVLDHIGKRFLRQSTMR